MSKERIALWDNLKFILITTVVVGHFADFFTDSSIICRSIFLFIYAFHMPLFLFAAGLFYSDKDILKKCLFYLCSGVLLRMTICTVSRLLGNTQPIFPLFNEDGISWFMYVMAAFTFLTWLLRNQNKKFFLLAAVLLACFAGYDKNIGDTLCMSRIIILFPFFFAGTLINTGSIMSFRKHRLLIIPAVAVILGWAALCLFKIDRIYFLRAFFTARHSFSSDVISYGPLIRLGCYILTCALGLALIILVPNINVKGITSIGSASLNVYFWHWPLYMLMKRFLHVDMLFNYGFEGKALFLLVGVLLTVIIAKIPIFKFPLNLVRKAVWKGNEPVKSE